MAEDPLRKLATKAEQALGIIPGTKFWTPFPFSGMNQQDAPTALTDTEFQYIENFFRLGNGYLHVGYDVGTPIFTSHHNKTIVSFFWYVLAAIDYAAVFFSDGTAVQVRQFDGATTPLVFADSSSPLFYVQGNVPPACVQWGALYLLISNNNTENDYWLWDGTNLYGAGTIAPVVTLNSSGINYTTLPTATVFGGSGSGIQLIPTINGGGVVNLTVKNDGQGSGYQVGDQLQVQFKGGGTDTEAAFVALLVPAGVAGVNVTVPGSGYLASFPVTFTPQSFDTGTTIVPAAGTANVLNGVVVSVTMTNHGSGYQAQPLVSFAAGSGTGAAGAAFLQAGIMNTETVPRMMGALASVIPAPGLPVGTNYIIQPKLEVIGNGEGALLTALLGPPDSSGNAQGTSVAYLNILSGGSGMFNPIKSVTFVSNGAGSGALVQLPSGAVQQAGELVQLTLEANGFGYQVPPTVFVEPSDADFKVTSNPLNGQTVTLANVEAIMKGTVIGQVLVSAPGTGYTQTPGIFVVPGANNAASATVEMMPYGVSGAAMETFQQQVYLFYPHQQYNIPTGGNFLLSAPESVSDFATSDGGLIFVNSDRFLKKQYVGARQSSGYLYIFGDDSISVLSNVQTAGSPSTTTFNYQNVDPQVGLAWRDTLQDFGRTILLANETGIYGLYGGAATKISGKLDNLFASAHFPEQGGLTPSAAVATVFNRRHYFMLMTVLNPFTGAPHNVMVTWNEKEWVLTSQTVNLTYIGTQEKNSQLTAWGTDGTALYPLFQTPSNTLVKTLVTKLYGNDQPMIYKQLLAFYLQAQDNTATQTGISFSLYLNSSGIVAPPASQVIGGFSNVATVPGLDLSSPAPLNVPAQFNATPPYFPLFGTAFTEANYGMLAMLTLTTQSPDFRLSNLLIAYRDYEAFIG